MNAPIQINIGGIPRHECSTWTQAMKYIVWCWLREHGLFNRRDNRRRQSVGVRRTDTKGLTEQQRQWKEG